MQPVQSDRQFAYLWNANAKLLYTFVHESIRKFGGLKGGNVPPSASIKDQDSTSIDSRQMAAALPFGTTYPKIAKSMLFPRTLIALHVLIAGALFQPLESVMWNLTWCVSSLTLTLLVLHAWDAARPPRLDLPSVNVSV